MRLRDATIDPLNSKYTLGVSVSRENSRRNRYCDIMPYERNRVKLDVMNKSNDYINASYVKLNLFPENPSKYYIATQGPTKNTYKQFWQMVYDKCPLGPDVVIVMVTPLVEQGREKCFKYWPSVSSSSSSSTPNSTIDIPREQVVQYGDDEEKARSEFKHELKLEFIDEQQYEEEKGKGSNHLYTRLKLTDVETNNYKIVHHLYFDKWADMSSPTSIENILTLIKHCDELNAQYRNPIISHCSAGVGRTGTFVALDYIYTRVPRKETGVETEDPESQKEQENHRGSDNNNSQLESKTQDQQQQQQQQRGKDVIQNVVLKLRSQRIKMVQTFDQYVFLYKAVKSFL